MRRVGKGFSGVETSLFEGMLIGQEIEEERDADEHFKDVTAGDDAQGDDTAVQNILVANVVADALSKKDKESIRVRALAVTVHNNLPEQILNAQVEACKEENIGAEGFLGKGEPFEVRHDEIVCRHGVPVSIILDQEPRFASRFWKSLQKSVGTNLDMSAAYHPETDGHRERTILTLEDMLRACVMDFGSS
nr:reverse transcriptase domain-containing protein [Tanacetum cinerariifolium]